MVAMQWGWVERKGEEERGRRGERVKMIQRQREGGEGRVRGKERGRERKGSEAEAEGQASESERGGFGSAQAGEASGPHKATDLDFCSNKADGCR